MMLFFFDRDIKCENLLLNTNYSIKLSDFGFARNNMLKKNGQMKTSSTFCGSFAYASPEILKGVPYQPNASDVWSIGVVLFAMLFGSLPFEDADYDVLLKVRIAQIILRLATHGQTPFILFFFSNKYYLSTHVKLDTIR